MLIEFEWVRIGHITSVSETTVHKRPNKSVMRLSSWCFNNIGIVRWQAIVVQYNFFMFLNNFLLPSSTANTEAPLPTETSINFCQTLRRHLPVSSTFHDSDHTTAVQTGHIKALKWHIICHHHVQGCRRTQPYAVAYC